ncbi:MAG: RNA polymerase subunit sigma-70 [Sandaracinus sp.]|nr:RNA polymerase subunit sigma-70 [Sandaracinus sp.]
MTTPEHRAASQAARESYGRLVAWLASRCGDIPLAEDAVADALEAALRQWPESGVPANPEAWLLTAARRRVIDGQRRRATRRAGEPVLTQQADEVAALRREAQEAAAVPFREHLPDRRLELLFVCAHPAIPADVRTPLMLQTVLGLNAERIGSALLVKPATMGQRLVRAKKRVREAGIPFERPAPEELPERLGYVLDAIYAAYGTGWEMGEGTGLAWEAIWLARLVVALLPDAAEGLGLYALMLHCEARRGARRDETGAFVPLEAQATTAWDHELILEAEKALWLASKRRTPGPYQLEASIQSIHAHRARSGVTDWAGVERLYAVLAREYPSLGATVGWAASRGRVGQPREGLALLASIPAARVARHQPYWAVRAFLLGAAGELAEARGAYERAAGLATDEAVRRWLLAQRPAESGEG